MSKAIILTPITRINIEPTKPKEQVIQDELTHKVFDFLLEQAEKDGCQLYGIVDSAGNEEVFRYLIIGNVKYKSLFEGTMDEQSYGVSAFLVECKKESLLFQWMTMEAWGNSCCIFFTSKASFADLFGHFQQFNRVYLEDDEVVLFRYYDPRVLSVYLPTCNRKEIETIYGEVTAFFTEGIEGMEINVFRYNPSGINQDHLLISKCIILQPDAGNT